MTKDELKKELLEDLCYYDIRHPDGYWVDNKDDDWRDGERKEPTGDVNCYCDACFHGNHRIAHHTLKLFYGI